MSVASDLLAAVKTIVEAAFSGKTVHLRRSSDKNPILAADMVFPCFAASLNDDRPTEVLYAGAKTVKYPLTLLYLTKELPGDRAASADVETTLATASGLFLVPRNNAGKPGLQGVAGFNACEVRPRAPYSLPFGDQTVNASPLLLTFEFIEDA